MHWTMPHVFNEITRYGLVDKLKMRKDANDYKAYLSLKCEDGRVVNLTPEEEVRASTSPMESATDKIVVTHKRKGPRHIFQH